MRIHYALFLLFLFKTSDLMTIPKWTETHIYHLKQSTKNKTITLRPQKKRAPFLFSQLLFSWNALRPEHGFFTFYVRVHDAKTNKWSKWHRMADWGNGIQRSFESEADATTSYHHVRLEMKKEHHADTYEILIKPTHKAPLKNLTFAAVVLSNLDHFKAERTHCGYTSWKTIKIPGVPRRSQVPFEEPGKRVLCSPTSLSMLVEYFCNTPVDVPSFAQKVYDNGLNIYGSWPFNTAHAFEACNHKIAFYVTRLHGFKDLYQLLLKQIPVEVSVRGSLPGAPKDYPNGHLLVVVGYDSKKRRVMCHDPAQEEGETLTYYPLIPFLRAWERSYRLAYVAKRLEEAP